ncbi:MAG: leucine-rich repeat domain-containing protein [Bacteroidales bacterium]|nr:leucine-rich repeat domain-containing protein [Bacteroidales bacterium]
MADSDELYFDYQLMNETFTSRGKKDISEIVLQKPMDSVFKAVDSRGREVKFVKLSMMFDEDRIYVYLKPMIPIQGFDEDDAVVFELDMYSYPRSMHAVKDEAKAAELETVLSRKHDRHPDNAVSLKARFEDQNDHGTISLSLRDGRDVHFRKLASMYIGDDLYVLFEALDCFDVFANFREIVYRYREEDSPWSFAMTDYRYQNIIVKRYRNESELRRKRDGNRRLYSTPPVYDEFLKKSTFIPAGGKNIYDILLGENVGSRESLVLIDDAERKISFRIDAVSSYGYRLYALLNPVTEIEGCGDDTEILFCVDDVNYFSPVLTVETRDEVCGKVSGGVRGIFARDGGVCPTYPSAEEIVGRCMYDRPVFLKKNGGDSCRFMLEYVTEERAGRTYAVLRALSSCRGFEEDLDYVFRMDRSGGDSRSVLEPEDDGGSADGIIKEYEEKKKSRESGKTNAAATKFTCRKCYAEYFGDVCPKCGTVRRNLDSANFPACTYLNRYSESYCRVYMEWEVREHDYMTHENFTRCGDESEGDAPCVMDFKPADGGFVVTGIGGCMAENVCIPSEHNGKPVFGVEKSAFAKCSVSVFHIPGTVKFIGASAFEGSPNLRRVELESMVRIEENTFADCPVYFWCRFPDGLESIGKHAFFNCKSIGELLIPVSLTSIEEGAFDGCSGIKSVYYKGSEDEWNKIKIEKNGNDALLGAEILFYSSEKPTRPGKFWHFQDGSSYQIRWRAYRESVSDYSAYVSNAYLPTYGLEYSETRDGYAVTGKGDCEEKDIVIPSTHMGKKVVAVGAEAFENDDDIRSVVISKGVNKIGRDAFYGCHRLKSVTILSDVSVIEERTFARCTSLKDMVIPDSCRKIEINAFSGCEYVTIYYKGDAARWRRIDTALEGNACLFDDSRILSYSEERPSPVKGHWHYSEKFKLTKWTGTQKGPLSSGKQSDGDVIKYPFDPTVNLPEEEAIFGNADDENLPHGLEYQRCGKCCAVAGIGSCTDIKKELVLPSMYNGLTVTQIGHSAFIGRTDITSVVIPRCVTEIDDEAFRGCTSLTEADIPDSLERIGNFAFCSCAIESLDMPENMWYHLGASAFENCRKLRSVVFGERMFDIPTGVFRGCTALEYVVFPHYFASVGPYAFESCESLRAVFYPSTEKEWKGERKYARFAEDGNGYFLNATIYFYSEERPEKTGNFWHYDDEDNPVIWDV